MKAELCSEIVGHQEFLCNFRQQHWSSWKLTTVAQIILVRMM